MLVRKNHIYKKTKSHLQFRLPWGFVLFIMLFSGTVKAQTVFEGLQEKMQTEPKFIVMDIGSRSCLPCMMQAKRIEKDESLKNRLDSEVYFLSWVVENTGDFSFNGKSFKTGESFIDTYGKDENGFWGYPLWMIFDQEYQVVYGYFGLISVKHLNDMLDILSTAAEEQ